MLHKPSFNQTAPIYRPTSIDSYDPRVPLINNSDDKTGPFSKLQLLSTKNTDHIYLTKCTQERGKANPFRIPAKTMNKLGIITDIFFISGNCYGYYI